MKLSKKHLPTLGLVVATLALLIPYVIYAAVYVPGSDTISCTPAGSISAGSQMTRTKWHFKVNHQGAETTIGVQRWYELWEDGFLWDYKRIGRTYYNTTEDVPPNVTNHPIWYNQDTGSWNFEAGENYWHKAFHKSSDAGFTGASKQVNITVLP